MTLGGIKVADGAPGGIRIREPFHAWIGTSRVGGSKGLYPFGPFGMTGLDYRSTLNPLQTYSQLGFGLPIDGASHGAGDRSLGY